MRFGRYLALAAATMLAAAPAMAAPVNSAPTVNPAASLSVANNLRTGSATTHKSKLTGIALIFAVFAGAGLIATVAFAISSTSDSK